MAVSASIGGGQPNPDPEIRARLAAMLKELSDPYRTVLRAIEVDGDTFAAAAVFLGLAEATVRLLHAEGRLRLRPIVLAHSEAELVREGSLSA